MKNPTDFGLTVETGVDPCVTNDESPTTAHCQVQCMEVEPFHYQVLKLS